MIVCYFFFLNSVIKYYFIYNRKIVNNTIEFNKIIQNYLLFIANITKKIYLCVIFVCLFFSF